MNNNIITRLAVSITAYFVFFYILSIFIPASFQIVLDGSQGFENEAKIILTVFYVSSAIRILPFFDSEILKKTLNVLWIEIKKTTTTIYLTYKLKK